MVKNLLVLLLVTLQTTLWAQNGSIHGKVLDKETGEPLIGASVIVNGTTKGGIADLQGEYLIKNVSVGSHIVKISYVGYEDFSLKVEVKEGETSEAAAVQLASSAVGLQEVEVFASVVDDRKTPIAVTSISAKDIDERFSGESLADIMQNTPGVYATQGNGGYGDQEVYIRGFDQSNIAFLVNGIPVNDMEDGRMYWSNFAGLNEVTRQMQVQRGLGASKLAISSIGGTVNMITKPSSNKEGGKIEYQFGQGAWNQRLRFTYHTGEFGKGWSASFQGSRTTTNSAIEGRDSRKGGSMVPGAYVDAWSYYLSISKKINDKHQLMFWGFGAPIDRGSALIVDEETRETFNITDPNVNNALGYYKGDLYNVRQNKLHKPLMALSHYWDIDATTHVSTSVYASFADVYSTQPVDAENSRFLPFRNPNNPDFGSYGVDFNQAFTTDGLINFDYLSSFNQNEATVYNPNGDINTPSYTGRVSRFYSEARYNKHNWLGLISNVKKTIGNVDLLAGVDLRRYRGRHYAEVYELFGGDFIYNKSSYGDDMNKLVSNDIAKVGDKTNYDYDGNVDWAAIFGQAEYNGDNYTAFATASVTNTTYERIGRFWNGRDIYTTNSLGESSKRSFTTYTLKGGFSYRPTNRHNVYINGGYFTRPPFMQNAFADSRYSNLYRDGITTEKIASGEAGYSYRTSRVKANINVYYLRWMDRTTTYNYDLGDENNENLLSSDVPGVINGLRSVHKGIEADFSYQLFPSFDIGGYLSLGDWQWDNNPTTVYQNEAGEILDQKTLDIKGIKVGTSAQTSAGINFHYSGIKDMYIGGRLNFYDRIPISFSPEDLLEGYITRDIISEEYPSYQTLNLYVGRYFDLSDKISGRITANVQNVTNEKYVRWASYYSNIVQNGYGYPRTFNIGLSVQF